MARINNIQPGDKLPEHLFEPDNIQLFLYNAVLWNAHRIHYDYPYATEQEGYPGLVVAGPLMGDWLTQVVLQWAGDEGSLASFSYTNRKYACIGEVLHSEGSVVSVDAKTGEVEIEVEILNAASDVLTPGKAIVRFSAG
jgi:3-methylfumaryl-CoA hydratase